MQENNRALEYERNKLQGQEWIKSSTAHLSSTLSGLTDVEGFADALVRELTPALKAQVGLFYQAEEDEDQALQLSMVGSYAYTRRKHLANRFALGEGMVGQCALERKAILLENAPQDYIHVVSGSGEAVSTHVIVFPVMHEDKLLGVVELASLQAFDDVQREFIEQVQRNIGVILSTIQSRRHTEQLLLQSQTMSEELQAQQEELRAANETLEEQTQQLKASEEELNVSNEELRLKQDVLQKQKDEIEGVKVELEKKARDLDQASQYKSEFLANMSHELRTPLNSMLILSKMLYDNKEGNLSDRQREDIQVIYSGGKDLLALINDIMDLSKVEAGMLDIHEEDVELDALHASVERLFGHVAEDKGLAFLRNQDEALPSAFRSDGQRLEQVLKNFLSNAFKFTDKGQVEFKILKPDAQMTFQSGLQPNETIGFAVSDTGIGIPAEKQQAIFESFQQQDGSTSRKYGGTGLGLSISRELARLLGGEIQLRSEPGKGSTFTLYLPLTPPPAEGRGAPAESLASRAQSAPASTEPQDPQETSEEAPLIMGTQVSAVSDHQPQVPAAGRVSDDSDSLALQSMEHFIDDDRRLIHRNDRTILVIEDDAGFAQVLLGIVRNQGYKGLATNKGRDGLYLAMQYRPNGVLLDLGLPDISGRVVLEQLKYHLDTRPIPVHVISGRDTEQNSLLAEGAFSFMTKPVEADAIEAILSGLDEQSYSGPKRVLVVEDDEKSQHAIERLIKSNDVEVVCAASGDEALSQLQGERFDCIILDLGLPDRNGYQLLEDLAALPQVNNTPVIIYTGQDISDEEQRALNKYTRNIIIKGAESPERLLDDVSLFLHKVTADLPDDQLDAISMLHNENAMLDGRRVLLVDDDMRNLFALSRQLDELGLEVEIASNGEEALEKLDQAEAAQPYELILMDIMMPVMDGYEAMGHIRQRQDYANVPIIALTAKAMQDDREKCIQAGASEYLTKPIDLAKLTSMLRIWLYKPSVRAD